MGILLTEDIINFIRRCTSLKSLAIIYDEGDLQVTASDIRVLFEDLESAKMIKQLALSGKHGSDELIEPVEELIAPKKSILFKESLWYVASVGTCMY